MTGLCINIKNISKVFPATDSTGRNLVFGADAPSLTGGKVAVNNLSLTITQGERVGIVGPNGAGKSTLLHMIAGLSSPNTGQIEVNGKITSVLTLGVGLREDLTGRENIYIDGEIQGYSRRAVDDVLEEIITFADLGEFIDYPIRTYSTGMKARLAFSMISHIEPEILIIDEALSVGDAAFAVKATRRIMEICARGKIVIVVSHSMQSVRDICNRCLWMDAGNVVMDGPAADVTKSYIQAVRGADEAVLLEKFRKFIGASTLLPGWAISDVALQGGSSFEPRNLLEVGQPMRVCIRALVPKFDSQPIIKIQITRLDGLLVFNETLLATEYRLPDESIGLNIEMPQLMLGVATYRLDVFLQPDELRVGARSATIFETYNLNAPTGGKPMLAYPIHVSSTKS